MTFGFSGEVLIEGQSSSGRRFENLSVLGDLKQEMVSELGLEVGCLAQNLPVGSLQVGSGIRRRVPQRVEPCQSSIQAELNLLQELGSR